jgi:hypothetical protein
LIYKKPKTERRPVYRRGNTYGALLQPEVVGWFGPGVGDLGIPHPDDEFGETWQPLKIKLLSESW